jgi:hypothetical protein
MPDETQTQPEPRCHACGQPLVTWADAHTIEDCRAWRRMSDTDRLHMIEDVMDGR